MFQIGGRWYAENKREFVDVKSGEKIPHEKEISSLWNESVVEVEDGVLGYQSHDSIVLFDMKRGETVEVYKIDSNTKENAHKQNYQASKQYVLKYYIMN